MIKIEINLPMVSVIKNTLAPCTANSLGSCFDKIKKVVIQPAKHISRPIKRKQNMQIDLFIASGSAIYFNSSFYIYYLVIFSFFSKEISLFFTLSNKLSYSF